MKPMSALHALVVIAASTTILLAQPGATPCPTAQPVPSVQGTPVAPSGAEKKALSEQDKPRVEAELDKLFARYSAKGNWYLGIYFLFAIGAALAGAAAGFLMQWDTPQKSYKRLATILAFVGSVLVIVTTYIDFRANSIANKMAANQIVHLRIQVEKGDIADRATILEREQEIYEGKQASEKVIEPPKK
jgi:hypothetical protein